MIIYRLTWNSFSLSDYSKDVLVDPVKRFLPFLTHLFRCRFWQLSRSQSQFQSGGSSSALSSTAAVSIKNSRVTKNHTWQNLTRLHVHSQNFSTRHPTFQPSSFLTPSYFRPSPFRGKSGSECWTELPEPRPQVQYEHQHPCREHRWNSRVKKVGERSRDF